MYKITVLRNVYILKMILLHHVSCVQK